MLKRLCRALCALLLLGVIAPAGLQKLMQREVGEPLRMRLARGGAEPFDVTLIPAVARPQ
jgi:hypothetical protein